MTASTRAVIGWHRPAASLEPAHALVRHRRLLLHPLTAICAVQAALSLTLVWSSTAFRDEASYLWVGHLVISHWRHGQALPQYAAGISGSSAIYPPMGALADSIGGLAGARILSLIFMLGATILLYLTAARLLGRTEAIVAAAIWALSEPVLRLAFATYDPLSVSLTALSAWLAVEAGYRRSRYWLIAASAAALAAANATAYSGIVIDPVIIAFALLVWLPRMGTRRAVCCAALLAAGCITFFGLLMTVTHSWPGIILSIVQRSSSDQQSFLLVLNDVWKYSALAIVLAVIGAAVAIVAERGPSAAVLVLLGSTVFVVPAAQLHYQTAFSIDKHLAYGIWFAAIAAGYGCTRLIRWLPGARRQFALLCGAIALVYPGVSSWQSAWLVDHSWPDARSFIASFSPVAAHSRGLIYTSGELTHIGQYYTPQGHDWRRWAGPNVLPLDPVAVPRDAWEPYYAAQLRSGNCQVITLLYATTFSSVKLPGTILLSPRTHHVYLDLLGLVGINSHEPGLSALTLAIEQDPAYRLVAVGPYDSGVSYLGNNYGVYAIWQKVAPR
jgi:hypothetical protein